MGSPVIEENIDRILNGKDIDGLLTLLQDENLMVREKAVTIIGDTGNPRVVRPLIDLLRSDREWRVQKAAAEALEKFGDKRAIEPLIEALKDKDKLVRQAAQEALAHEPRAVDPLIQLLDDKDRSVRWQVVSLLEVLGDKKAVEPLIRMIRDPDQNVRKTAVRALGRLTDDRAEDSLIEALKDKNEQVREVAASALGRFKSSKVIEPLIGRLGSDETQEEVRNAAKGALKGCRENAIKPLLNEMIEVTDGMKRDNIKEVLEHLFGQFLRFEDALAKPKVKKKKVIRAIKILPDDTDNAKAEKTDDESESLESDDKDKPDKKPLKSEDQLSSGPKDKSAEVQATQSQSAGKKATKAKEKVKKAPPESANSESRPDDDGGDVVGRLEKLVEMKEKGFIDDAEFKEGKKKLLWG
ncbi:MAG: HEAT repeat domain-containing protein [Candidatus Thermoplasmatota archaeon]|jgi:hypothetical protein|nr:HEAT repeat domain-containing protein [Candidatus Thermoplasmatota archaeon]